MLRSDKAAQQQQPALRQHLGCESSLLGLTQPRLNDLLRGRINKFSLDALVNIGMAAGLEVRVAVVKAA